MLLVLVAVTHYNPPARPLLDRSASGDLDTGEAGEGGGGDPVLQIAM